MKNTDSKEKSVLITGGTSGLGLELVRLFLNNGYSVIATGRQLIKLGDFGDRFKLIQIDFNDMNNVSDSIKKITEAYDIGIVINNAGVLSPPDFTSSINGFEYTLQVNYLSHLLINEIVLMKAKASDPVIIAAVTSPVYRLADSDLSIARGIDIYRAMSVYTSSKLYLTLMCEFLPKRFPELNLQCFSFDPGTFNSGIYRTQKSWFRALYQIAAPFMRSPLKVAEILFQLLKEKELMNGMIYDVRKRSRQIPVACQSEKEDFQNACYNLIAPYIIKN
jgi:NAD(P)-dependent dehydrogenase (short-subunit alcohol dehydrogenase family)